jgi:IPT/TIG domain
MTPAAGVTGQAVTLTGAGLFSPDGLITVRFGNAIASTVCPDQNTCRVKVPVLTSRPGGPTPVTVTVTTDTGTSNGLAFRYG